MKYVMSSFVAIGLLASAATATAEVDGKKLTKQACFSCHNFDDAPRVKTGPNLFGVAGSKAGTQANFKRGTKTAYSKGMQKIAETGLVWTDENLKAYLADPKGFLQEKSGDPAARSAMVIPKFTDEQITAIVEELKTFK